LTQIGTDFNLGLFPEFLAGYAPVMFWMAIGFFLHLLPASAEQKAQEVVVRLPLFFKATLIALIAVLVMQIKSADVQPFIYFQF
ncbi:MAG TPA: MBOAT family protein, partial [Saprospiraceae bacterium]|nr:MBOAT family protein [Saprospiraceae bacterium]